MAGKAPDRGFSDKHNLETMCCCATEVQAVVSFSEIRHIGTLPAFFCPNGCGRGLTLVPNGPLRFGLEVVPDASKMNCNGWDADVSQANGRYRVMLSHA